VAQLRRLRRRLESALVEVPACGAIRAAASMKTNWWPEELVASNGRRIPTVNDTYANVRFNRWFNPIIAHQL
jgi:hypothetical protein